MRAKILITLTVCLLPLVTNAATSAIVRLQVITNPQSIAPGQTSEVITVQTQNAAGEAEKLDDTADLTFTSSSPTGEFLGSTGSEVTTTMSKGSANRNFFYRDQTAGTHTLTVTVRPRDGGGEWTTAQSITVGSGSTQTATTTASSASLSGDSYHASQQELSEEELIELTTAGIGRDRNIPINVPIQFTLAGAPQRGVYDWAFGDGTAGSGQNVRHLYQTEGDYVVMLNAMVQGKEIVARTHVHVYTPAIIALPTELPKTLVIKNTGDREVNIGGWFLESNGVEQRIPRDTILLPGARISLSMLVAPNIRSPIALYYPNRVLVARYNPDSIEALRAQVQALRPPTTAAKPPILKKVAATALSATTTSKSETRVSDPIVLPVRRSWWQLFIDNVFARN